MLVACLLSGFCLPVLANTTGLPVSRNPQLLAQTDLALPPVPSPLVDLPMVRIALLLPTQSDSLRGAAEMVRAGFQAGFDREPDGVDVQLVETGDAPQDVLSGFNAASVEHDIVVGPLSRTGVTAVAQSGLLQRPTIALNSPDTSGEVPLVLPPQMLPIGLSIEDEARQVAGWAATQHPRARALVVFTGAAWQRRAARAFEQQWQQLGRESEPVELVSNDGYVNASPLLQFKMQQQDAPTLIFAALDARQARQIRSLMGPEMPLYGTSQLNPVALPLAGAAEIMTDMDGVRLLDIPWQLQPDHPAVMSYPVLPPLPGQMRSADLERLYALGIDAYRIAHEIAMQRRRFEIDGVTGRLGVSLEDAGARFTRIAEKAIYRNGTVVPLQNGR
jgi:outer membrane PBP1 activator LpoA protein